MMVKAKLPPVALVEGDAGSLKAGIMENDDCLIIGINRPDRSMLSIRMVDMTGRILISEEVDDMADYTEIQISKNDISKGIVVLSISTSTRHITEKFVIR